MSSASSHIHRAHSFTWKSYGLLRKKAMEQELSWSGLMVSLSIAFFIVAGCATTLHIAERSFREKRAPKTEFINERIPETATMARGFFSIPVASAAAPALAAAPAKSTETISLPKGGELSHSITFKNTGSTVWKPAEVTFETGPYLKTFSKVQAANWKSFYEPAKLPREVKPGQSVTVAFTLKAPLDVEGTIQENFQLVSKSQPVNGSLVRFFITLTDAVSAPVVKVPSAPAAPVILPASSSASASSGAAADAQKSKADLCIASFPLNSADYISCNTNSNESGAGSGVIPNILINTLPMMRVGLFSSLSPQRLSVDRSYDVYGGTQLLLNSLAGGTVVTLSYDQQTSLYAVSGPSGTITTKAPLRLVPETNGGIATLLDYRVGQKPQDNRFRNIIELNYSTGSKTAWIINELPVEDYVKGLAETTNASPVEFQKVMATIARTYALYHYLRGVSFGLPDASTKHAADHFHVDAVYDQVYRGYNSELRLTGLTQAVEATRGLAVVYNGALAITPYFSNSGGRTLDWTEVWGGEGMPWLKSVAVPQDAGKTLYGHGVGLSARGALLMVVEGKAWQEVLKYFYTGVDIRKVY